MKALIANEFGLPDSLAFTEVASPSPAKDEVLIAVRACGVNFPDVLIIQNKYQFKPTLPFSPGGEVAGEIISCGEDIKGFKPGQRVVALCGWGGFAEKVSVKVNRIFPLPDPIDFITGATTLYTYGTSYHALKDRSNLKAGETLLVLGAAGGVGLAAVELAKVIGATVIAAASSKEKLDICRLKGADHVINYSNEDLRGRVGEITHGQGADVVFDPVGGSLAESAVRSLAWKGRYLVVGFAAGAIPQFAGNIPLLKGASIVGVFWGSFSEKEPALNRSNINDLIQWIMSGKIRQHIYKSYPLSASADALTDLMNRKVIGKAVVTTA